VRVTDEALLVRLKTNRSLENEILVEILNDLIEVEARGLYLKRGFSSVYEFCLKELKYSESEALLRINAMRLIRAVPEVEEKIEGGILSLTNAAEVGRQIRRENQRRRKTMESPLQKSEQLDLVESVQNISTRECQRRLSRSLPDIQELGQEKTKVLRDENTLIQFVADKELNQKLERLKEIFAHKNFEGRYDKLFHELADIALAHADPLRKPLREAGPKALREAQEKHLGKNVGKREGETLRKPISKANAAPLPIAPTVEGSSNQSIASKPNQSIARKSDQRTMQANETKLKSRAVRLTIKRKLIHEAQAQCEYIDLLTGRRCGCRHGLEIDHRHRLSAGGSNEISNLRVLCDAHNRGRERFNLDSET
jgi:5-methylcytosine-specific restriction endonuclease McrA